MSAPLMHSADTGRHLPHLITHPSASYLYPFPLPPALPRLATEWQWFINDHSRIHFTSEQRAAINKYCERLSLIASGKSLPLRN